MKDYLSFIPYSERRNISDSLLFAKESELIEKRNKAIRTAENRMESFERRKNARVLINTIDTILNAHKLAL